MPSSYSTNLKIELQATGENSGTWGTITNTNLGTALEQAIIGYGNPSYPSDANLTLTYTDTNAAQAARALVLNVTSVGSLTATRELVVPTIQKQYIVQNNTTGAQSITVKTSGGTGITVTNGRKAHLYVDGTNVIFMDDFVDINGGAIDGTTIGGSSAAAGTFTTLTTSSTVTLNGGTANGVLYLNGSKVATSGSALTYNGSNLINTNGYVSTSGDFRLNNATFSRVAIGDGGGGFVGGYNITYSGSPIYDSTGAISGVYYSSSGNVQFFAGGSAAAGTAAPEAMRLTASGNLGIGTSSPASKLHVDSDATNTTVTIESDLDGGSLFTSGINLLREGTVAGSRIQSIRDAGAGGVGLNFLTTADNAAEIAGTLTSRMVIDRSGNVGIGTASPGVKFHVANDGAGEADVARFSRTNAGDLHLLDIGVNPDTNFVTFDSTGSAAGGYTFRRGGTDAMTLDSSGNLGIGTSSPGAPLNVKKNSAGAVVEMLRLTNDGPGAGSMSKITFDASGTAYAAITGGFGTGGPQIKFELPTSTGGSWDWIYQSTTLATLLTSGNLGIGTSSPAYKLDVQGNGSFTSGASVTNVFVGSAAGNGGATVRFLGSNTQKNWMIGNQFNVNGGLEFTPSTTTGGSTFTTPAMTIDSSGNLGIGTTSPSTRLHVAGSSPVLVIDQSAGTTATLSYRNGNSEYASVFGNSSNGELRHTSGPSVAFGGFHTFYTDTVERARITSGGDLLVGTTSSGGAGGATIVPLGGGAGTCAIQIFNKTNTASDSAILFRVAGTTVSGISYTNTTVTYGTVSDYRLKNVIGVINDSGTRIDALKPIEYTWNSNGERARGFLAHQFQEVYASSVNGTKDAVDAEGKPAYQSMQASTSEVIADLVAEIQSLRARVAQLETK